MTSLWGRLAGFAGLPMISMITPLLVLPVFSRLAGPQGWASVAAGEAVGTLAAIAISYGWNVAGPPRIAATDDPVARATLYRESLLVRGALFAAALPVIGGVCLAIAADGFLGPTLLMGVSGAVTGLSFAWFAVGAGDPRSIAVYEAVPRVLAAGVATAVILLTHRLEVYPVLAVTVSLLGVVLFSRRLLAGLDLGPIDVRSLPRLLRRDRGVAAIDVAGGAYASVPLPVVSVLSPPAPASAFASGDKLYKFGLYLPITLGNAFQSWTVEGERSGRARRLRVALGSHVLLGAFGGLGLAVLGPFATRLLFGADVEVGHDVATWLGVTFLLVSTRISLTRHFLIPAGQVRVVFVSTMAGAALGLPLVVLGTWAVGPVGAAAAVALSEVLATGLLVAPAWRQHDVVVAAGLRTGADPHGPVER